MNTGWFRRFCFATPTSKESRFLVLAAAGLAGLTYRLGPYWWCPAVLLTTIGLGWRGLLGSTIVMYACGQSPWALLATGLACHLVLEHLRELHHKESQHSRTQQELLKTLVHELRNPLFAAKGTIDNLCGRFQEIKPDQLENQLVMASTALQTINQEVDDLTQLFRVEGDGLVARLSTVNVSSVFASLLRRHPEEAHPAHSLVVDGTATTLRADPLLLIQALDKLITNAVVHSSGGEVRVSVYPQVGATWIDVSDQGPGIPVADRQSVFDKDKRMNHESAGFGLGLFLARQYILVQGGELTLEDSDQGCLFRIKLPVE